VEPRTKKSKTDIDEAKRTNLRIDSEAPKCTLSSTDSENTEPRRAIPNNDIEEPILRLVRTDSDAPRCKKSSTDREDPILAKLRIASEAPN
jgi:hypothetical protein